MTMVHLKNLSMLAVTSIKSQESLRLSSVAIGRFLLFGTKCIRVRRAVVVASYNIALLGA